jgi:squalene/oxidosqualene cyclase-like protein
VPCHRHWSLRVAVQLASFVNSLVDISCDMIFRAQQIRSYVVNGGKPTDLKTQPKTAKEAVKKAAHFYSMLQTEDGHWAGDYGGPHFLMPGLIIAWYIMGQPSLMLNAQQTKLMKHYISVHQQVDGGWGTHVESPSTMFGTTLMYVSLRLLGVEMDDPRCQKGRAFIQNEGGAVMTASWAKFYLCLLGCMEWDGHNSVPAEFWFLPNWFPFHPGRLWCHCRMVYLPMGYLYGSRFVYSNASTDAVVQSLRKELYVEDYDSINWMKTRHLVAEMDNYSPIPLFMKVMQNALARYECWPVLQPLKKYVRKFGLQYSLEYMKAEDLQTNYINIGPVNKVLNMLSAYLGKLEDVGEGRDVPGLLAHNANVERCSIWQ